ncbi:unnamed protein product [Linum trigynum]|uniref:Fe-S metabolism associated domain-containing protein n=1 Tax=Linum trigynum TaxID=586398 RepID=A0AAV2CVU9_9ROSI
MISTSFNQPHLRFPSLTHEKNTNHLRPNRNRFIPRIRIPPNSSLECNCRRENRFSDPGRQGNNKRPDLSVRYATAECLTAAISEPGLLGDRLRVLVSEFGSLTEPLDRVRRLLDYAGRLPPFDESSRVESNRVGGCTTQVWLEVELDEEGNARFRADSDSEITKGFISCLVWLLDGAAPEEVAAVEAEDLEVMNVGFNGRTPSRVKTWHNVLAAMQKRALALSNKKKRKMKKKPLIVPPILPLIVAAEALAGNLPNSQVVDHI